ncbi:hypothetical protein C8A01DRAFT_19047 [Parachaetomium inaequale]|uniref:HMG box domain-containing protein n=1 Tax=Parachaetomium inaequale TaxID=2588326 RepID=A0AAN6P980_9PEZI|nr:hypothetical protein C8A01DRAFT_19047 [Parachaetomium inaequale]
MTQLLGTILGELGIAQYLEAFLEQGFDSWETILDITESDLDALGVKLGHRRKLQRRIADSRGIASDASLVSPIQSAAEELKLQDAIKPEAPAPDGRETVGVIVTKRKYRRHPKPDENAPERPPSAYVLFSNKMREELKGRNLSFTEIAKLVGENWQSLTAAEKEPFESQAQAIKDKYLSDLSEYKKTPEYRKYISYLQEFKAKHASPSQDNKDASKRVRLSESESQGRSSPGVTTTRTSRSGSGADSRRGSEPPTARQRVASVVSSDSQYTVSLTPSTAITSPDESVLSSAESNCEPHSMDRSPTFSLDPRDQPSLPGPRHPSQGEDQTREHLSMHRHLPSLSDVFDGQGLPGGMHPPSEPGGYRFPTAHNMAGNHGPPLGHPSGDARPAPLANGNGHPFGGSSSSLPPFNHPRPQVDGPLPIHALLSSKSEPTFHSHPPPHLHHPNPYHVDQSPRLVHQPQSGAAGLPMMNGYHHHHPPPSLSHHQPPVNEHHINQDFSTQPHQAPPPASGIPQQGKQTANLDGMSALLKAGEIVDRRMQ